MPIIGQMFIGRDAFNGSGRSFYAIEAETGLSAPPAYGSAKISDVDRACKLAADAFDTYRATSSEMRAAFLERCADAILGIGDELIARAHIETGLTYARLEGERARTVNQLRLFAAEIRDDAYLNIRIDTQTAAQPDLRLRMIPLGPVAVFGASNFPLAFSVAGGDTAAALAAGCPVVVKAHSAHPGTSELVGRAVQSAVQAAGLPEGVFSMLFGTGSEIGQAIVANPHIKAVGFTGSRTGGTALMKTAAARAEPIPVYAEMSSLNPVFLLPGALASRAQEIGKNFADSLTLGAGQFCTNPGLVFTCSGRNFDLFIDATKSALAQKPAQTMLTPHILDAYRRGTAKMTAETGVREVASGQSEHSAFEGVARLFETSAAHFMSAPELSEEIFGASSLIVRCENIETFAELAEHLDGQLTATLHMTEEDRDLAQKLLPILERKAGRILINGFPTGVQVSRAMVHGGPFPATSDGKSTSVGTLAIVRFLRPVCYQDFPAFLLPPELRQA